MKRVLVTGATGFIGRHCPLELVRRGYEVHAVCWPEQRPSEGGVIWHQADLLEGPRPEALVDAIRPSHLLHLAWYAVPGKFWTSTANLRWVSASLRLLLEFTRAGGRRVVMAGTCAEYDWSYPVCIEGQTPLNPSTLYGACKHAVQSVLAAWSKLQNLSWAWGRVFFLYGPGEHPDRLVAYVIRSLLSGQRARCTSGKQVRDFMHVQDVAGAFVSLLDGEVCGPVNIAGGQGVPLCDMIRRIADIQGKPDMVELGAIPDRPGEPASLVADVRRLRDEVGFAPTFTLDDGLAQTIQWWRENQSR